ncbi:uncharacterized protein LOC111895629 [Lactuca sativa]|uniref:uncharacterized protein LOC111895629 n=1 Tax=Lactuca sativa TaxID=4236 RepID=UPI000CC04E1A|nr:uncharacterized protein LOC111895629 [Lactuca sativa]
MEATPATSRLEIDPSARGFKCSSKAISMEATQATSRLEIDPSAMAFKRSSKAISMEATQATSRLEIDPSARAFKRSSKAISMEATQATSHLEIDPLNYTISLPLPVVPPAAAPRTRRNGRQAPRHGKSPTIPPPFPWATNHRATVHSIKHLTDAGINVISGNMHCKRCDRQYKIEYDLKQKFHDIACYVAENKYKFRERAPATWMNPVLPKCNHCGQDNVMKPVMAEKKKEINWLFLLLGQMLGCCTLEQLKYFCKHTKNHRTGAKDRVLFLTYLGLCKQVDPNGPFERE